ncbi:MAG: hypothetical protein MJA83_03330 [Gammaproteobacteria bacterium]|nr:hypothetical protein [Gammaproteobacteria bacterium]
MERKYSEDPLVVHLATKLGPPILTTSEEIRFNCFRADCGGGRPDTKYHLYMNPIKEKWFCQRCKFGGSVDFMFKLLGLTLPRKNLSLWDQVIQKFLYGKYEGEDKAERCSVSLPLDYTEMIPGTKAYEYCLSRGISPARIDKYKIGFGTAHLGTLPKEDRKFYAGKYRLVIPDFDSSGEVTYWVARTYGSHTAKYKNAQAPSEFQVFNIGRFEKFENFSHSRRVVICEGPISAIVAGYDAVATYGNFVTGEQLDRLVRLKVGEYIVAFDGDAVGAAMSLASRLQRRSCPVKLVNFAYNEDPASVGPLEIRERIMKAPSWNDLAALEAIV